MSNCLIAAFTAVGAATLMAADHERTGVWVAEAAIVIAAHGSARLLWLFRSVVAIVAAGDHDEVNEPREERYPSAKIVGL